MQGLRDLRLLGGRELFQGMGGISARDLEPLARKSRFSSVALATRCGLTLRELRRCFEASNEETLQQWLDRIRLKEAFRRLADGESLAEVCFHSGFATASHFSRCFRNYYGMAPAAVLAQVKLHKASAQEFSTYPVQMHLF